MSVPPADQWRRFLSDLHTWKRGDKRAVSTPQPRLITSAAKGASAQPRGTRA